MRRRGFTLIEILVSLMIFTVVSVAMLGIMFTASDIYRRGEAGRAANDEAVAVMAALDEDLSRLVPASDGGWFYASMDSAVPGSGDGNTLIAFRVARRDRSQISERGAGDREIVAWWVKNGVLMRGELPAELLDDDPNTDQDLATLDQILTKPGAQNQITVGCLHFGAYLADSAAGRDLAEEWLTEPGVTKKTLPNPDVPALNTTGQIAAFPAAIRITTVLTGGSRFATKGFLVEKISDSDKTLRIAGIPGLSTLPGAMVKVVDPANPDGGEWIGYHGFANGRLDCSDAGDPLVGRGRRRSVAAAFPTRSEVRIGQSFSLVRTLPH